MSQEQSYDNSKVFYSVIDGSFRVQVPESHPDAVKRDWETPDGKSGTKWERQVNALFGTIADLRFRDGDYGKNVEITLDANEDGQFPVISLSATSRYGEDFLKKLPNLKPHEEYRFMPFAFVPEGKDKEVRGVSITSKDDEGKFTVKVPNFFWDGEKASHGYPEPDEDDKADWAFFYKKAGKFLVRYAEEKVLSKFSQEKPDGFATFKHPVEEIDPESIPF